MGKRATGISGKISIGTIINKVYTQKNPTKTDGRLICVVQKWWPQAIDQSLPCSIIIIIIIIIVNLKHEAKTTSLSVG